jgi:tRNA threonylcarbamoyladenosine biosynthesis protein TsaE
MLAFGQALGSRLVSGDWVAIHGPLGAGKTVLCKGVLRGLGFTGEVTSPSYAIVNRYDPPDVQIGVSHVDLYRLESIDELEELGLSDGAADCITLVEWANRFPTAHENPSHIIDIKPLENGEREMKVTRAHDS